MDKNRGRKHLLNKSKYNKNKPKANIPIPNNKSKSLETNWDRYEEELSSINDYVQVGSDFSLLANAPISKGSHFQFKAEAIKNQDIKNTQIDTSGLFNIDLNLIGLSLSTIPFHERCGLSTDYFSFCQQNIMVQTARNNEKVYKQSLSKHLDDKSSIDEYFFLTKSEDSSNFYKNQSNICLDDDQFIITGKLEESKGLHQSSSKISVLGSDLAELNENFSNPKDIQIETASSILETESLQQWLDDVLGD